MALEDLNDTSCRKHQVFEHNDLSILQSDAAAFLRTLLDGDVLSLDKCAGPIDKERVVRHESLAGCLDPKPRSERDG